jgi:hypothetical protein
LNSTAASRSHARGNTLVLVTAILVLLVIVATAFLVRAQSGRAQAAAQQKATGCCGVDVPSRQGRARSARNSAWTGPGLVRR